MDITHAGSSMKWRASLLVLRVRIKLRYISPTVTNPSPHNWPLRSAARTYQCIDILLFVQ